MDYLDDAMYSEDVYDYSQLVEEYTVEDVRKDLRRVVDWFQSRPDWKEGLEAFMVNYRGFPLEEAIKADAFDVDENIELKDLPDWMKNNSLGFVKYNSIVMSGRCVFPVKDCYGSVMGLVGWDPFEKPKYLDSKNFGYKAKITSLFGMEVIGQYYTSKEPVFVTEGLMCALYLRWKGFQALSSLGSYLSRYVIQILSRFGRRLVMIPDNDETGDSYIRQIKRELPKAIIAQVAYGKDIDGCRKKSDGIYENELLKDLKNISNPFIKTEMLIRR